MQILVIGESYQAGKVADTLAKDKNDIVFTTGMCETANKIEINPNDKNDLKDFIVGNEIGLLVPVGILKFNLNEISNETECLVLSPDKLINKLAETRFSAKKFAYKSNVPTLKFSFFEKIQPAIEFLREANFPIVIQTDIINGKEPPFIAETRDKALAKTESLFNTGNRKIIIENYTEGAIYTKYIVMDGVCAESLFETYSYFEELSTNNTRYLKEDVRAKIENELIPNIVDSFMEEGVEHRGILGLSFVIAKGKTPYFLQFEPFIKSLDLDIFLNTFDTPLKELFLCCANGTLDTLDIKFNEKYAISFFDPETSYNTVFGGTMNRVFELVDFEGLDKKILKEALEQFDY